MARRTRRGRGSRHGGVLLRGKIRNSGESLSSPPATEPADGRARPDSQGIRIFPLRTTPPRPQRPPARPPGAPPGSAAGCAPAGLGEDLIEIAVARHQARHFDEDELAR